MTVAVLIPTYNGAHKIKGVLQCLDRQTVIPDEIIVVIDGSSDNTIEVIEHCELKLRSRLKVLNQVNKGRAHVRNTAAKQANSELLVFFDDDMLPEPNCIAEHLKKQALCPGSIVTGGLEEPLDEHTKDIVRFKAQLSKLWNNQLRNHKDGLLEGDNAFITAANFSVAKSVFDRLGGFDERLNDAEDYDLCVRAVMAGVPLYYHWDAFAWHNDLLTCKTYIRRLRQYAQAHQKLQTIKKDYPVKYKQQQPEGLKYYFFRLFAFRFWIDSIDKNFWANTLPQSWRYKLYDYVITANGVYFTDLVKL